MQALTETELPSSGLPNVFWSMATIGGSFPVNVLAVLDFADLVFLHSITSHRDVFSQESGLPAVVSCRHCAT